MRIHFIQHVAYESPGNLLQWAGGKTNPVLENLPDEFITFHRHGDTFDLPAGAVLSSQEHYAGNNQRLATRLSAFANSRVYSPSLAS